MPPSHLAQGEGPTLVPLNSALSTPCDFLHPSKKLRTGILDTAKFFLDSLAVSVSDSQVTRQRNNRKRKRSGVEDEITNVLQLKQLYVDGFSSDQIWEQALRIFDSADQEIERDYTIWAQNTQQPAHELSASPVSLDGVSEDESVLGDGDSASDLEGSMDGSSIDVDKDPEGLDIDAEIAPSDSEEGLLDESDADGDDDHADTYVEDRFGLNDGFFSIDDFNKQTELFERQDARGDVNDESDEDEVDWHTDPLGAGGLSLPARNKVDKFDDGMSESDEEGPTFDNIGADSESDLDEDDPPADALGAGFSNTSDIMYTDFFAPPPRKASKKRSRLLPKTQPTEITENDIDRAMADVRRDLFDDEESAGESENEPGSPENSRGNRSTHEKQRSRIADEIRRLEAASIAKKEWMLSGEARAAERPMNSLIEEDLDFERIGKPVPVVTTELSEGIEDLVKRRIIAKEFDEVIRRRPGLPDKRNAQKARVELEDGKPQQSLAELYEADHLRATDANYADPENQKLFKEHTEITNLWRDITSQLDTLSNWHYKPKAPQASINVVTDVATITMEDAQPTTSGTVRASAALAPQEIYAPGETTRSPGEVVMRNGVPITKEEMSREDKSRLRRRQKKQGQASAEHSKKRSDKAVEKQQIVSDLKKGGVKVIGKGGDMMNLDGSKVTGKGDKSGAHAMKL
ncbi:U3 small nucleolar ribonucleoprotein complex, subunit Mpp10 [Aspergillus pseudoustus]|uniref:U3 small nucleolar ribonucleoprotein protein MPP10 n=1 Tax=Aspergillus pseudoustus TaxID=1810923 RepID=A0ABR4J0Y4_9EURO